MNTNRQLREQLIQLLDWQEAHLNFDVVIEDFSEELRGLRPPGLPYSAWELLEHLRRCQHDILTFCTNADYQEPEWPQEFWPTNPAPPNSGDWLKSINQYQDDLQAIKELISDPELDIFAKIPHGDGQTYLREFLLIADHNAYHLGQIVVIGRALGLWS